MKAHFNIQKTVLAAIVSFSIISCTDPNLSDSSSKPLNDQQSDDATQERGATSFPLFLRTIGSPVNGATGRQWISNLAISLSSQRSFTYTVSSADLKRLLSNDACTGISLCYASDDAGQLHIIPVGRTLQGAELPLQSITLSSGTISWNVAQRMIGQYTGTIRSHFFGANTFARLFKDGGCPSSVRVSMATDTNNNQVLLLSDASVSSPDAYEDFSSPCPPYGNCKPN